MQDHPLPLFVSTFVPLRIRELQQVGGATEQDFERARAFVPDLCEHGDALLYREKGRTGEMAGRLVDAIAVLAFLPGGISIFGQHFEAVMQSVNKCRFCGGSLLPGATYCGMCDRYDDNRGELPYEDLEDEGDV